VAAVKEAEEVVLAGVVEEGVATNAMPYNIRIVSTYPPRKCGVGTFSRDLASALENFTGEVGHIRVAAIDKDKLPYNIPVDLIIHQYDPASWHKASDDIVGRANESANPTVVLLQHEYGLDPDKDGSDSRGTNFVAMAKTLRRQGLMALVYLHTVLDSPDEHQKKVLQDLADNTDGLLVTTENALDLLESATYGINRSKVKHIDHGIRMQNPSQYDRLSIKQEYGLQDRLLVTTLGLHSPGKGLQYSIRAYARFLHESCTKAQKRKTVYLIAGACHPEFVKREGGKLYREYQTMLNQSLDDSRLRWCKVKDFGTTDFEQYDVVFLDTFLDESTLLKLYGATNIMVLPYLNMQQISSGILADTVGSGRVAVATKFKYAVELISPEAQGRKGAIIAPHTRGVLVDPGEPSVEQMAQALDYLVFNRDERLEMETRAHERGYQMRWHNSAWELLQYVQFLREKQEIVTGRGVEFAREKPSIFEKEIARRSGSPGPH
jgi:glycosyltransferase involved in cell wall biosynthesis